MKIVSSIDMFNIDRKAESEYGYPSIVLMENAGQRGFDLFVKKYFIDDSPKKLCFAAGKGNNGGDAFVMARRAFLDNKYDVSVILTSEGSYSELCEKQLFLCKKLGINLISWDRERDLSKKKVIEADYIFDGIAGTGLKKEIRYHNLVNQINTSPALKIAIDVPSGVGDDFKRGYLSVRADITLTFGLPKLCLYMPEARKFCGKIEVIKIGFPGELKSDSSFRGELIDIDDLKKMIVKKEKYSYKNMKGSVAVFAGDTGTTGAAILSSYAAARSRAGLVTIFAESSIYNVVASQMKSIMVKKLDGDAAIGEFNQQKYDSVIVGPGWGRSPAKRELLKLLLRKNLPVILDADAIFLLKELMAENKEVIQTVENRKWILTPHPGEMADFMDIPREDLLDRPLFYLEELSRFLEAVVVLKTHVSYIMRPDGRFWIMDGMNPASGTAGSGDILAGIIAGVCAGGEEISMAARIGVLIHKSLGKKFFEKAGWFLAEDLLSGISAEFLKYDGP